MAKQGKKAKKADAKAAKRPPNVLKAVEIGALQQPFSHPWNPNSELHGVRLGDHVGFKRLGVALARIPAGKESYVPHAHHHEEEWLYILMGEGLALIGDKEVPVGMGDFLAFPAPQVTHHLKNAGVDDLVYLMGGQKLEMDVVDFPTLGKVMVWDGGAPSVYDAGAGANPFAPPAKTAKKKKKK